MPNNDSSPLSWLSKQKHLNSHLLDLIQHFSQVLPSLKPSESGSQTDNAVPLDAYTSRLNEQVKNDFQWLFLNKQDWKTQKLFDTDLILHELDLEENQQLKSQRKREDAGLTDQEKLLQYDEIELFRAKEASLALQHSELTQAMSDLSEDALRSHEALRNYQFVHSQVLPEKITVNLLLSLPSHIQCLGVLYQLYLHSIISSGPSGRSQEKIRMQETVVDHVKTVLAGVNLPRHLPPIVPSVNEQEVAFNTFLCALKDNAPGLNPHIYHWRNTKRFRQRFIGDLMQYFQRQHGLPQHHQIPILVKRNHRYMLVFGLRWRGCDSRDENAFLETKFRHLGLYKEGSPNVAHFNNYPYYFSDTGSPCIASDEKTLTTELDRSKDHNRVWSLYPHNIPTENLQLHADPLTPHPEVDARTAAQLITSFMQTNPLFVLNQILQARETNQPIALRNALVHTHRKLHLLDFTREGTNSASPTRFDIHDFARKLRHYWESYPDKKNILLNLKRGQPSEMLSSLTLPLLYKYHDVHVNIHDLKFALIHLFPFLKDNIHSFTSEDVRALQRFCLSVLHDSVFDKTLGLRARINDERQSSMTVAFSELRNALTPNSQSHTTLDTIVDWTHTHSSPSTPPSFNSDLNDILSAMRHNMYAKHRTLLITSLFLTGLYDPEHSRVLDYFTAFHVKQLLTARPEYAPLISRTLHNPIQHPGFILHRAPPTTTQVLMSFFLTFKSLFVNRFDGMEDAHGEMMGNVSFDTYAIVDDSASEPILRFLSIIAKECHMTVDRLTKHPRFPHLIIQLLQIFTNLWSETDVGRHEKPVSHDVLIGALQKQLPRLLQQMEGFEIDERKLHDDLHRLTMQLIELKIFAPDPNQDVDSADAALTPEELERQSIVYKLTRYWNFHWEELCDKVPDSMSPSVSQQPTALPLNVDQIHAVLESTSHRTIRVHPTQVLHPRMLSTLDSMEHYAKSLPSTPLTYPLPQSEDPLTSKFIPDHLMPQLPPRPPHSQLNDSNRTTLSDYLFDGFIFASDDYDKLLYPGLSTKEFGFIQMDTTSDEANHPLMLNSTLFASQSAEGDVIYTRSLLKNPHKNAPFRNLLAVPGSLENRRAIARELIDAESTGSQLRTTLDNYATRTSSQLNETNTKEAPIKAQNMELHDKDPQQEYILYCFYQRSIEMIESHVSPSTVNLSYEIRQEIRREFELLRTNILDTDTQLRTVVDDCISMILTYTHLNKYLLNQLKVILEERILNYELMEEKDDLMSFLLEEASPLDSSSGLYNVNSLVGLSTLRTEEDEYEKDFHLGTDEEDAAVTTSNESYLTTRQQSSYHDTVSEKLTEVWSEFEEQVEEEMMEQFGGNALDLTLTWSRLLSILSWDHLQQFLPSIEVSKVERLLHVHRARCRKVFSERLLRDSDQPIASNLSHTHRFIPFRTESPESSFAGGHCDLLVYSFGDNPSQSSQLTIPPAHEIRNLQSVRDVGLGWMDIDAFVGSGCAAGQGFWLGDESRASTPHDTSPIGHAFRYDPSESLQENYRLNAQMFLSDLNALQYPQSFVGNEKSKAVPESVYELIFCFFGDWK